MIRVLLIAPYREFAEGFAEVFAEHNATTGRADYEKENYRLSTVVAAGTEELKSLEFDAEVVVSRGFISSELRNLKYYVPVVEVPVAAVDLAQSLHRAKTEFGCRKVGVVGTHGMVMGVERLADFFSLEIVQYALESRDEIRATVEKIRAAGVPVVVGGVRTCAIARELGLKAVLLESGRESMWHSITEAKRLAYVVRREEERAQHLGTLVARAQEGVITLDRDGRIKLFNRAASRIFGLSEADALEKPLEAVLPALSRCTDCKRDHEVVKHGDKHISVSVTDLNLRGEPQGALIIAQDVSRVQELESRIRERVYVRGHVARHTFDDIIGDSQRIKDTIARAKRFSDVDSNILIWGKTGTGKELFAQSIHNWSRRSGGPFVAVNCAALSESLLESELFGYAEGAFTGASKGGKPGLFELAHRGTLFLDEISEIPMRLQGRLLRAIQEKEIMRLGHDRVIPVDVRIVAATNRVLDRLVEDGAFREDLFYRLNILNLDLPALSERSEDIPALTEYWVGYYCRQFGFPEKNVTEKALYLLRGLHWPGNIRQLRNVCERLVVLSQSDVIDDRDAALVLENALYSSENRDRDGFMNDREMDPAIIESALRKTGNNRCKAAHSLGISRTTLWRRMKQMKRLERERNGFSPGSARPE